ncbi:hypothetical protein FEM48_Zijuj09G0217700 [Ziziphus jujuba var. spinosa]|uniref:Amidase domain-containing protein n=1 Tax=Ziziphus jujuba var. spinosa TaxID=714518 RepID=A0A978UVH7_ZIZJJ|nr:hypothetical protein FEM48_Zijuj09G0217700 [Ziziphus jujuba var. spinosa]
MVVNRLSDSCAADYHKVMNVSIGFYEEDVLEIVMKGQVVEYKQSKAFLLHMRKKRVMVPVEEVDLSAVKYEEEEFQVAELKYQKHPCLNLNFLPRKQATASTRRFEEGNPLSILYGIFVAIKDDIDCYPHRTTGATTWMHGLCFVMENAVCVSRLHRCGVIFVGKANTH